MTRFNRLIFLALVLCIALAACQRRSAAVRADQPQPRQPANTLATAPANTLDPRFSLAVAPFSGAANQWQLLSGTAPSQNILPGQQELVSLDATLLTALQVRPGRTIISGSAMGPCMGSVQRAPGVSRQATLRYWQKVGQCAHTEYLLVPIVVQWRDLSGSGGGSSTPAWVILDLYLINVETGELVKQFHYDYQQQALADNLLTVGSFLKRRGRWLSAADLAREGIQQGIRELGL